MTRSTSRKRQAETGWSGSTATNSTSTAPRMMDQSNSQQRHTPHNQSLTPVSGGSDDEIGRLRTRVGELQRERDHLIAVVDILQEVSSSFYYVHNLEAIARKLGN